MDHSTTNRLSSPTWIGQLALALCLPVLTVTATPSVVLGQSVEIGDGQVTIRDAGDAVRIDIGSDVIVEGQEIRVVDPATDLQALIDSIADEGPDKPYLVRLGHGRFDVSAPLVLAPWISLRGSGETATRLVGAVSSGTVAASAIVIGADDVLLSDLTIENQGGGAQATALYNSGASPTLQRVTLIASGATNNRGIFNFAASSPVLSQVTVEVSGGTSSRGIENITASAPVITELHVDVSGATTAIGIYNDGSSPTLRTALIEVADGTTNTAIYNDSVASPEMTQVSAHASGGSDSTGLYNGLLSAPTITGGVIRATGGSSTNYGVFNFDSSSAAFVRNSEIEGSTAAIHITSAGARFANIHLIGPVGSDPAGTQCRNLSSGTIC